MKQSVNHNEKAASIIALRLRPLAGVQMNDATVGQKLLGQRRRILPQPVRAA